MRIALIIIASLVIIGIAYYYLIYKPSLPAEGSACKVGPLPGTIVNGKCQLVVSPGGNINFNP